MAFPGTHNINYYQGDSFDFSITPKNSDGSMFNLSGYSSKFFIANKRGAGATQYECVAGIFEGQVLCIIPPAVGRQLTPGTTYYYDVEITKASTSTVYTILTGTVSVTADVTGAV